MKLKGHHCTHYDFATPVTLEMHTVRLRPRSGGGQLLRSFTIQVDPVPSMQSDILDAEGNGLINLWFLGKTNHLRIETCFEVETLRTNSFDFIASPEAALPLVLAEEDRTLMGPALKTDCDEAVQALARTLADGCSGSVLGYVGRANSWIYNHIRYETREDGDPLSPGETLALNAGACRDTAVLLIALCRTLGVPARFVSGYQEGGPDVEQRDLHAWAEVWVPGGGWRGFDPTHGLAVSDGHIAVAASALPNKTAPVAGGFYSNTSVARIPQHEIEIKVDGAGIS